VRAPAQVFNSLDDFASEYGELSNSAQVERLNALIRPYLLRRQKNDVEKSLAPLEETIIWVGCLPRPCVSTSRQTDCLTD
jgi:SNF2 family DNA or RNA helicase